MIFSKTFNSDLYSQIVVMLDRESGYGYGFNVPVVKFYFYVDRSVHNFNVSFGSDDLGLKIRQEYFDGITSVDAESIVYDKLAEGKI